MAYLSIIPVHSVIFPWTLFTATYVEQNILSLIVSIATLAYGAKYCERVWGSMELAKFLAIVGILSNFIVFLISILAYAITSDTVIEYVPFESALPDLFFCGDLLT